MSPDLRPSDPVVTGHDLPDSLPAGADKGSDDGVLDSIGKAIVAPVEGAAEPEEPTTDSLRAPVVPE